MILPARKPATAPMIKNQMIPMMVSPCSWMLKNDTQADLPPTTR
jgi:hypothetical protein